MTGKDICKKLCGVSNDPMHFDIAMLIIRLSVAATFIVHGWMKIQNMEATIGFFASLGFGAAITYVVAYVEFLGGILMAAGVMTRLVGGLFAATMVVAIYVVHFKNGFNTMAGGYEFQLLLLACSVAIALIGPGKMSVHSKCCEGMTK